MLESTGRSETMSMVRGTRGNGFGLDYEPVLVAANGTVICAGWQNWADRTAGYGLHLRISHDGGYATRYGHLSTLAVITNALVTCSQIIGTGSNIDNSIGTHLHCKVRLNDNPTDSFSGSGLQWLWQAVHRAGAMDRPTNTELRDFPRR